MVFERLMWGSDWNDPRLAALLEQRPPASVCAACDRPLGERPDAGARLLCAGCGAVDQAD